MLRAAVERQCEITGEALAKLAKADEPVAARISDYRRIIAFRNILIHGYTDVDHRLVWDVVTTRVPILVAEVSGLLESVFTGDHAPVEDITRSMLGNITDPEDEGPARHRIVLQKRIFMRCRRLRRRVLSLA